MPHLKGATDVKDGNTDGMDLIAGWAITGCKILVVVGMISLVYHGINSLVGAMRELRTENGNISNLMTHVLGAVICIGLGLVVGFYGWQIILAYNESNAG